MSDPWTIAEQAFNCPASGFRFEFTRAEGGLPKLTVYNADLTKQLVITFLENGTREYVLRPFGQPMASAKDLIAEFGHAESVQRGGEDHRPGGR